MFREALIQIYENDLRKVIAEIGLYQTEEDIWRVAPGITNSGGNLALHLIGNINHFFGAVLGKTGYKREREAEFSSTNASRADLIDGLENAVAVLKNTLNDLSDEDFQQEYPQAFGPEPQKTGSVVIYMLSHLNYHLGQINYHRRFFSK